MRNIVKKKRPETAHRFGTTSSSSSSPAMLSGINLCRPDAHAKTGDGHGEVLEYQRERKGEKSLPPFANGQRGHLLE